MAEEITFHFEGQLADRHRMNFYEAARFQYAAARLMVKLAQFRREGKFVRNITNSSNIDIQLATQADGSFNMNIEDNSPPEKLFVDVPLADLIAYVSERLITKIDDLSLDILEANPALEKIGDLSVKSLDKLVESAIADETFMKSLPDEVRNLVTRRVAETFRQERLVANEDQIAKIDFDRGQKLLAMSAPLISEMEVGLRRSARSLEVRSSRAGVERSVLYLDRGIAREIETATVDKEITPLLGDISQFNKENGWGKLKIEEGTRTLSFSIPFDVLRKIRQQLIENMKQDLVYLQTQFVRDRGGEVVRLIIVGILPTPEF